MINNPKEDIVRIQITLERRVFDQMEKLLTQHGRGKPMRGAYSKFIGSLISEHQAKERIKSEKETNEAKGIVGAWGWD